MANAITSITTDLTTFGRILLAETRSRMVAARLAVRGNPAGASMIGNKIEIPDLDVSGDAATLAIGGTASASDVTSTKRTLTVERIYKAVTVDNLENVFSSVDMMTRMASRIAYKVAKKCDSIVCGLWNEIPYEVGKLDGSAVFNSTDKHTVLADAYKTLFDNEADLDGLVAILGSKEANAFRKLDNLWKVNEAGNSDVLRTQFLGSILGFTLYESQQIQDQLTSVAAETSSPGAVVGAHAVGVTSLSVNGLGTGTVKKGTTFALGSYRYVVTADATITTNAATLLIYPALKEAQSGSEAVTFTEHSTAASSQNLAFHPEAIRTVSVAPAPFREGSGVASAVVSDPQTGLSIRVAAESKLLGAPGYTESLSADVIFGAKVVRPEWAVRITGD